MLNDSELRLRSVSVSDAEEILKWRFSSENYNYFYEFFPISLDNNIKWIQNILTKNTEINCIIEKYDENIPIGMISLVDIDMRSRKCELGRVLIGDIKYRKKGYGKRSICLLLEYAFYHLNINKVYCEVFAENKNAVSLYKRIGFSEDGYFIKHIFKNGCYKDILHMSLFKEEYNR